MASKNFVKLMDILELKTTETGWKDIFFERGMCFKGNCMHTLEPRR